jgi:hypothetical protein
MKTERLWKKKIAFLSKDGVQITVDSIRQAEELYGDKLPREVRYKEVKQFDDGKVEDYEPPSLKFVG